MAIYTHYKLPIVKITDSINLSNFELNQLIIVNESDFKYYVVADNTNGLTLVGDAIANGYLKPFPNISYRDNISVFYSHTDYISPKNLLWLRQLIFKNKSLVKVFINGTLFEDWEFGNQYQNNAGYTQHLSFPNGSPAGEIKIVYNEPIKLGGQYNIRLDRYDGGSRSKARNSMINKTIVHPSYGNMFLENAQMINDDPTFWRVTYRQFNGTNTYVIDKKFFNTISIGGFLFGEAFPDNLFLEVWGYDRVTNFNNNGNTGGRSFSRRSTYYPFTVLGVNKLMLDFESSAPQWGRTNQLMFRFRQEIDGKVYFSEFFKEKVSIKHFPVIATDATMSEEIYKGVYISTKLV